MIELKKVSCKSKNPLIKNTVKFKKFHHQNFDSNYKNIESELIKLSKNKKLSINVLNEHKLLITEKVKQHNITIDQNLYYSFIWDIIWLFLYGTKKDNFFNNHLEKNQPAIVHHYYNLGYIFHKNKTNSYIVYLNRNKIEYLYKKRDKTFDSTLSRKKFSLMLNTLFTNGFSLKLNDSIFLKSKNISNEEYRNLNKLTNKDQNNNGTTFSIGANTGEIKFGNKITFINIKQICLNNCNNELAKKNISQRNKEIWTQFKKYVLSTNYKDHIPFDTYIKELKKIEKRTQN